MADQNPTVVLSSHLLADVERVCDYLVVLADGGVRVAGVVDDLLADAQGAHRAPPRLQRDPQRPEVVRASHTDRQTTLLVRTDQPVLDPRWAVSDVGLEELVLAYMASAGAPRLSSADRGGAT